MLGRLCATFLATQLAFVSAQSAMSFQTDSTSASFADAKAMFDRGDYRGCEELAVSKIETGGASEVWFTLAVMAQNEQGRYGQAVEVGSQGLEIFRGSLELRNKTAIALRYSGKSSEALRMLDEIHERYRSDSWQYRLPSERIVLAEYYLSRGVDPKSVLTDFLRPLPKTHFGANMAIGNLAHSKGDFAMAAEHFRAASEIEPQNPEAFFGLARAYEPNDHELYQTNLQKALELNPHFVPALNSVADNLIDGEKYAGAIEVLDQVFSINPTQVDALALRAVIHHLMNEPKAEGECRDLALSTWNGNPAYDYLVGKKLSQKYRFAEGADYQRRSLIYEPSYLPAKLQLAQDVLRQGDELQGWKLADEVFSADAYNVAASNLVTLQGNLAVYQSIYSPDFVIRMSSRESELYGAEVLRFLERAKETLCKKYDFQISKPIYVEIFEKQQDFAVRTFGMPGGAGFRGVCFGKVITMNSPATEGDRPTNWQNVLWHEFCHVVTLQKTNNKMPRWLSEGISVYEERCENPAWGQSMNDSFRAMMLGDDFVPLSQLSNAFLSPKSGMHLQFAYFESSLAVEFLIERHGMDLIKRLLVDLGLGTSANEALEHYLGSLDQLDVDFRAYVVEKAKGFGSDELFVKPTLPEIVTPQTLVELVEKYPDNFVVLQQYATFLIQNSEWSQAKTIAEKLNQLLPEYRGENDPYQVLAQAHRGLNETAAEIAALQKYVQRNADALSERVRLFELLWEQNAYQECQVLAEECLAVNPLVTTGYQLLARASEKTADWETNVRAWSGLATLDPVDPAESRYRLAEATFAQGEYDRAKRQVLMALEFAPRYPAAQKLLLKVNDQLQSQSTAPQKKN